MLGVRSANRLPISTNSAIVRPTVYIVCEGLQAPPRAGFHVHLLSLAHGLASQVDVKAFAWASRRDTGDWERWVSTLPAGPSPDDYVIPVGGRNRSGNAIARKLSYWRTVQRHLGADARRGDVLWVRDFSTAILGAPSIFGWLPGRRGLIHVYDASSMIDLELGLREPEFGHRVKGIMERWLRRDFHLVRTLGEGMRGELVRSGVPAERILVAPVGAHRTIRERRSPARLQRLLYVGSPSAWQGLDHLLDAMKILEVRLPAVRLSVVGVPASHGIAAHTGSNVDFLGWVERGEMQRLYETHDLFVIPRPRLPLTETVIPMKCVEAQAQGIPILASRLGAIEEVTAGESAWLVEPGSATALAEGVVALANDPSRLSAMGEAAERRSLAFDWPEIGRRITARLFEEIPSGHRTDVELP